MNFSFPAEIFYGLGALILAIALAYAFFRDKTRNKALDSVGEAATRAEYRRPDPDEPTR